MRKNNKIYVDIHVLQTLPPSCVNRDDTGSPKTAVYGGVTRARVSSQAWKRAMREMFKDIFETDDIGRRTKCIPTLVAEEIRQLDPSIDEKKAAKLANEVLKSGGLKIKEKEDKVDALFFISQEQIRVLAKLAVDGTTDKDICKNALKANPSIDIALFGRMVAADPDLGYDAAAQVAHAISTHAVQNEYDYFTAVDECVTHGAGHLDTVEFNSSTVYRYATVNVCELAKHTGDDVCTVVAGFVEAFALSMPTGKQNTFANRNLPDIVHVVIRRDQPVSFAGAYENPVRETGCGYVVESIERLVDYANEMYDSYVSVPAASWTTGLHGKIEELGKHIALDDMLEEIRTSVSKILSETRC